MSTGHVHGPACAGAKAPGAEGPLAGVSTGMDDQAAAAARGDAAGAAQLAQPFPARAERAQPGLGAAVVRD
ncbi:MAG TPA: hypothetical protein VFB94_13730, partial [Acidimicrobiales bacterium]|nr:hypothetical protein [Acidimicrobiales bacterium]